MNKTGGLYGRFGKRALDIVISAAALLLLCWLYAILAILVRVKLGHPVLFRQERIGLDDRRFRLCKFRSMTDERDENGVLLPDPERLPRFGRTLRSTSLDELPELWNILKGDMSLVGPRPLLPEYLPYYTPEERHRHDVRPGLTGLAQISGRNYLSWEEVFAYDLEYVKTLSFKTDCRIFFGTLRSVVRREGVADPVKAAEKTGQEPKIHFPLNIERGTDHATGDRQ